MIWLSYLLIIVNPLSAIMLALLVLQLRHRLRMGFVIRFWAALLAGALIVHAVEQVELIQNYRAPRAFTWTAVYAGMHGLIWAAFWRAFVRHP